MKWSRAHGLVQPMLTQTYVATRRESQPLLKLQGFFLSEHKYVADIKFLSIIIILVLFKTSL